MSDRGLRHSSILLQDQRSYFVCADASLQRAGSDAQNKRKWYKEQRSPTGTTEIFSEAPESRCHYCCLTFELPEEEWQVKIYKMWPCISSVAYQKLVLHSVPRPIATGPPQENTNRHVRKVACMLISVAARVSKRYNTFIYLHRPIDNQ